MDRSCRPPSYQPPSYQPLALCLLSVLIGIMIDRFLPFAWFFWFAIVLSGLSAAYLFRKHQRVATCCILLAVGSFFGLRHHLHFYRFQANDPGFYANTEGKPCCIEGTVLEMPRLLVVPSPDPSRAFMPQESTLFTLHADRLRDTEADGTVHWHPVDGRVSVRVAGNRSELGSGERVRLFGELSKPHPPQNPGDADRRIMLRNRRILAELRSNFPGSVHVLSGDSSQFRTHDTQHGTLHGAQHEKIGKIFRSSAVSASLEALRRRVRRTIQANMSGDTAPIATAMVLGIREEIDEGTNRILRETGTIHILAISGLHIGLLAAVVGGMLTLFGMPRRLTAVLLILAVLGYLFMTDVRPPAIRATVLVVVACVALYFDRRIISVNSLAFTALVVLAVNPTEMFQLGAQLSFLGTGVFLWLPQRREPPGPDDKPETTDGNKADATPNERRRTRAAMSPVRLSLRRFRDGIVRLFLGSLCIWLTLMPLILGRIHLFTPVAILVNPLLWLPLTASLMGAFSVVAAGFFDTITGTIMDMIAFTGPVSGPVTVLHVAPFFGWIADTAVRSLLGLIALFHKMPFGYYWLPGPPLWWTIIFYVPLVFWTLVPSMRPRGRILLVSAVAWVSVGFLHGYLRDREIAGNERLGIHVCSVGHGLAVLILAPDGTTTIYDAGSLSSPWSSANILSRQLWHAGKTRIDWVVLSHPDNDHFNAVVLLAERFRIGEVVVPPGMFEKRNDSLHLLQDTLEKKNIPVRVGRKGDRFDMPDDSGSSRPSSYSVRILHPDGSAAVDVDKNANAASLVLLIEHLGYRVLLSGDLDTPRRPTFLQEPPIDIDLLFLPHHGGKSDSAAPLLAWSTPEHLLISGGRFWRNPQSIDDYLRKGYRVHETCDHGMISIRIDHGGMNVERFSERMSE